MPLKLVKSPLTSKVYLKSPFLYSLGPLTGIIFSETPTCINAGLRALSIASSPKFSSSVTP